MSFKRCILITGSTDGIGLETAKRLAKNPENRVVCHGRSAEKCQKALEKITEDSGSKALDYVVADFGKLSEVAAMAREVSEKFKDLNVIVCNAGVKPPSQRQITQDGFEIGFQVSYFR